MRPTTFEDLVNDLYYEVFEYLKATELFFSFCDLNTRFNQLLTTARLKVDLRDMAKSSFDTFCHHLIARSKPLQFDCLTLSNIRTMGQIRLFFNQFDLHLFTQLKSLCLHGILDAEIRLLLPHLVSFTQLEHLTIMPHKDFGYLNYFTRKPHKDYGHLSAATTTALCQLVFNATTFPKLTSCKLGFYISYQPQLQATSSLRWLAVEQVESMDSLQDILRCMPNAKWLQVGEIDYEHHQPTKKKTVKKQVRARDIWWIIEIDTTLFLFCLVMHDTKLKTLEIPKKCDRCYFLSCKRKCEIISWRKGRRLCMHP